MTDNELLLAMSDIMRTQLKTELEPIKQDIRDINLRLENKIEPQIQLLAENYLPSAKRYEKASNEIEIMQADIELMKKVIQEHSEKLQKIS